jgi:kumamolisin
LGPADRRIEGLCMNESHRAAQDRPAEVLELRALAGSERPATPTPRDVSAVPEDSVIEVTLVLRRRGEPPSPVGTQPISPRELADRYGADPIDVTRVTETLTRLGTHVIGVDAAARLIRISGTVGLLSRVFGTSLTQPSDAGADTVATQRRRTGGLSVPRELDGVVTAVLGLDNRPQARTRFRTVDPSAVSVSYTPLDLARIYQFPEGVDGTGQRIAIIELGGGFATDDLNAYFGGLGLTLPKVDAVGVDGAQNSPGTDQNTDGEVMLDIEVAGALAPGAGVVVYFAPNTDAGFLDAISRAAHATPTPAAMSISWGGSEDSWTGQARTAMDQALADSAALGVTVTAAAGDNGSSDQAPGQSGGSDGQPHVDFPASSSHALACGGTRLEADTSTGAVTSETVWNNDQGGHATGGGISRVFPRPDWQASAGVPSTAGATGRGVPDVAAVADPQTGYRVRVDGRDGVIGGTSAVAPLWAGLVARLVQATGRKLGPLQPALYASVSAGQTAPGFRDITVGNNGAYPAGPGWDPCTGLGVPNGAELLTRLRQGQPPAG